MTDALSLDLKPCPFCGSRDALQIYDGKDTLQTASLLKGPLTGNTFSILCNILLAGCGAEAGVRVTPDRAISAWNDRATIIPPGSIN